MTMRFSRADAAATRQQRHFLGRLLAGVALLVTSPLLAVAGMAVKLSDPGQVLYRAERAGLRGRPFVMYKLRTMRRLMAGGPRVTGADDPRIFLAGRWIRRLKLDELPQLINVVRGEMALVGPRPEDLSIVREHYNDAMLQTLEVVPGLTSPGTLWYFANESSFPTESDVVEEHYLADVLPYKIALDLVYLHHRSWRYDLQLVLRTLAAVVGVTKPFAAKEAWEAGQAVEIVQRTRPHRKQQPEGRSA